MAEDFRAKITAELDTAAAENKLEAFLNKKNKLKIDVEVNQDSAKKLGSSIERGIRQTKFDTSSITEQLAGSFNISDKNVLSRMKKQMDTMVSSLGKTWNGSDFDFKNASGFYSGLNNLSDTVTKNAKIVQGKTGIYDDFFNYFKDKKIYVSDELKKAMGGDAYKELLQNNIGKIVRDSAKGVSIDSIWGEMTSLFPEHFSTDMMNQMDQITHAFDLMKQARADMTQSFSVSDRKGADFTAMTDSIAEQVLAAGTQLKDALQTNLMSATEAAKTMIDLDVEVNTEKIASDIRSAVQSAGTEAGEALNVDLKINDEQLISELRSAVGQLGTGEEPVKVNLQVDRESLQSDLNLTLNDLELPVHFKVDAEEIESQLRAAVESITDIQIDLRVNTDPVTDATAQAANTGNIQAEVPVTAPQTDTSGLTQLQQALGSVNTAGQRSQSIFSSLGSSFREAFSAYSLANLMQDGLYKITDAGKEALSTVKEFNDLETDLAMATGESRSYASDLTQSYNALGQELGSITSDVAKSADSWLRQGRSMSETNQLIKDSMVLSKDAQMDSENASEVLTATLNGFQMNADQAGHINDVLTSIDLESASDAGGIGQALTKVASQANNAGVSLEKTAAMIATIKDVTQDSDDSIGTGLKSILSRMNQIKAGKFVDSETGESLNDVEKVLNKVGISMRDVNGQFKESEPIIDEVAGKWSTFDGNTKKAVATAMAGTYQYNKLIAMFDNWDKVQSLTETALNADGTAQKKFEDNYLTSLEAKTNALKASLENLATSTVSSDLYSGFLDGSKSLVDFANNINLVQSAIAGLGAAGGVYAIQQIVAAFRELSNLGNALNLSRAVNIPDDSFQRLLTLTQGLSESQTRLVLSSTALTDAQRAAILTNQGMSSAEAQASVAAMGLSTAEGAAAASTFSLSGALSGLWDTLMANPLILVAAGVTAAVSAFSAYQHSVEEAVSSAKQAGTEWQENNTSLQDNIERITELRTALSSGTLTEQEAASAKSELLSIQESLTDSYHSQVAGIDLINGSLEEQIALLDKVSQKEASQFQNENKKGIEEAEKKVEKKRHTYLGQFLDNGSKESEAIKKSINDLKKEYGDEVFTIEPEMDGITMDVHFKADSVTAKQALNDFMDDAKSIEKQYGESDTLSVMLDNASGGLSEANEILGKYGDLYEQAQEAKLVAEEQTFKADGKDQTALKWLNDYTKAVKNYNDALTEGDSDKITQAAGEFETVDTAVQSLLKNSDMFQFADQFSEVRDQLNDTAIAANQFSDALSGKDTSKFGKEIKKNADSLKELGLTDTDFKYAFETEGVQEGEDQINALVDAAVECGLISDTSSSEVAKLVNMLTQLGVISSSAGASVDSTTEAVSDLADQIINAQEALSGIEKATSVLTSQSTGKSISLDDFNSDELSDYTSALEYNNGALHLNAEKVRELQKAKAEEAIQTNENQKLEKQAQYMQNIAEIERLQDELRNLSDAKSQNAQTIQSSIDALLSENDGLVNQCNQLDLLSASLREATGAYQNWLDKQNTSESGDMFDDAMGALDHIEDVTQNTDSEDYGRIGTNSYKAAVDFIVPDSVDTEDAEAVSSYINSIEHYFNHDSDGNRTGLDVAEFCAKATKAGLMELDEASGEYKIAGQRTMQDFADGLNLSLPMVQAMFGEMEEFGGEFDWADEAVKTLGDLGMAAGEAKGRIEELSGDKDLDIQIDVSDIESTEDKIKTLDNTISQMQEYKGTLEVDSSQVDDANTVIQYCVTQKQMLEAPAVMSVDTSQVDGELGNALSLLQQFQEAQNNVELQASVGADTSEAQGKVDGLVSEIQGLSPEIKATLGIDGTSEATITASIQALSPKIMVEAKEDYYAALAENRIAHGKSQKIGSVYYQDLKKQRDYAQYQKDWTAKEMKAVQKRMSEYLKTNGNNRKDKAYQEMLKQYTELKTTYAKADTHIQELTQAIQDARENVKQWSVDRWDRAGSKQDAAINYKIVSDNPDRQIAEKDYTERIKTNNRQILALQKLRQEKAEYYDTHFSSWNNEEAQKYLDSITKIDEQILNLGSSTEELKNKIMELRWKPFNDFQDELDSVINEYQTMQKLLGDEDSFYNDDGSLTQKNNLMKRDESKTRKCIITAIGGGGLAKATCTVHVMPDSHYEKIKDYANKAGIKDTSGNNLRDAMEYAYKNGANHSNQSYTAVEGFKKAYLKDWTNSLPNRPDGATDVPTGVSPLIGYFNAKGKKVGPKEMQQLADILQINTPGVKNYDSWESTLKNKILKVYKSYGFSKGGVVRKGIPASILDMIGGDALIPRGDSMLIGANPGETVLTKEFTDQLKPTVATLNEFNARMAKPITEPSAAVQNQTTEVANEYHFTFNNPVIKSEEDVRKLIEKAMDDRTKRNKRDWKKVI